MHSRGPRQRAGGGPGSACACEGLWASLAMPLHRRRPATYHPFCAALGALVAEHIVVARVIVRLRGTLNPKNGQPSHGPRPVEIEMAAACRGVEEARLVRRRPALTQVVLRRGSGRSITRPTRIASRTSCICLSLWKAGRQAGRQAGMDCMASAAGVDGWVGYERLCQARRHPPGQHIAPHPTPAPKLLSRCAGQIEAGSQGQHARQRLLGCGRGEELAMQGLGQRRRAGM